MATAKLRSLQSLRAMAATLVVIRHIGESLVHYGWCNYSDFIIELFQYGAIGVDIFFVISGFVMCTITHGRQSSTRFAGQFMWDRILRIVPMYWILTALYISFLLVYPSLFRLSTFDSWHALSSFLFIPSYNSMGEIAPVLGVGWTLNYEMWFYLLFSLTLFLTSHRAIFIGFAILFTSSMSLIPINNPVFLTYTNPIVIEFLFGFCFGSLYLKGFTISPILSIIVILLVFTSLKPLYLLSSGSYRFLAFGLPSLFFVISVISLESKIKWNSFFQKLGDASYSLYLTHTFSILATIKAIQIVDQQHRLPVILVFLVPAAVAIAVSLATFNWVEKPINIALRSRTKSMRAYSELS